MKCRTLILVLPIVLTACVDLKEVRNFATESAKLSGYTELSTRFRDTFERQKPYLSGENLQAEEANDKQRKEIYPDLIRIHERASRYLLTLAKLAGDDTFDLSPRIDTVGDRINDHPQFPIEAKHVQAYTELGKLVAKWSTSRSQQRAVREMVREGNEPLQVLLDGMGDLVRLYRKTHEQERNAVLGFFQVQLPFHDPQQDTLLLALARTHEQAKEREYRLAGATYDDAEQGIRKISAGHAALLSNMNNLDADEIKSFIGGAAKEIKILREHIQTLSD